MQAGEEEEDEERQPPTPFTLHSGGQIDAVQKLNTPFWELVI